MWESEAFPKLETVAEIKTNSFEKNISNDNSLSI